MQFCIFFGLTPVPASNFTILCYISFLARTLKPSSINNYINIIRILHLEANLQNPLANNFAVLNLKRGISRSLGVPPRQKLPITVDILLKIREFLNFKTGRDISFWCACILAFLGFLRKSTLLPKSLTNPGSDCVLRRDLRMPAYNEVMLHIRKTKTIQFGQKVLLVPYSGSPVECPLCPVTAVRNLLHSIPYKPDLPLFAYYEGNKLKWWFHTSFTSHLKKLLDLAGFDAVDYSCHSFRRGGASFAFEMGMHFLDIKQRGDWASNAVEKYIHMSNDHVKTIGKKLSWGVAMKCH